MDQLSNIDRLISDSPTYDPYNFNSDEKTRNTHNCYDYIMDNYQPQKRKTHPGFTKLGNNLNGSNVRTCSQMMRRLAMDHPEIISIPYNMECPPGSYKIGMMLDPEKDYHFVRQDKTGRWSHKPGKDDATDVDFSDNLLTDPENADFDYQSVGLNYYVKCGYYCIQSLRD